MRTITEVNFKSRFGVRCIQEENTIGKADVACFSSVIQIITVVPKFVIFGLFKKKTLIDGVNSQLYLSRAHFFSILDLQTRYFLCLVSLDFW